LKLKRVVIQNYRSCLKTSIDLDPNLSVLIGPNGSGKTNILQAIMYLNKLAQQGNFISSRKRTITVSSRINASFHHGDQRIQLNASVSGYTDEAINDVILASREKWFCKRRRGRQVSLDVPLAFVSFLGTRDVSGHTVFLHHFQRVYPLEMPKKAASWTFRALSRVATYCRGIRYYGASQFTNPGSCPVSFEIIEEKGERRRPFRLRGHAKILFDMYSAERADSNRPYQQFIDIVGPKGLDLIDELTFREVRTSSTDYSVRVGGRIEVRKRHKLLVIPQFRIGRQKLSPNQLSEGTFKTLALLFHVITEDSTVLLIEEPEVCVHHGLLASILELIKSHSQRKQMILSTHSDYVLDHVTPENVYRVKFEHPAGTAISHVPETMTVKEFSALREYLEREGNLGEFWREGGLGDRP